MFYLFKRSLECFSIECRKTKSNLKYQSEEGKYPEKPMPIQSKTDQIA